MECCDHETMRAMLHQILEVGGTPWNQMAKPYYISCNSVVGRFTLYDTVWEKVAQYWPRIGDDSTTNKQVNRHVYHCV